MEHNSKSIYLIWGCNILAILASPLLVSGYGWWLTCPYERLHWDVMCSERRDYCNYVVLHKYVSDEYKSG